MLVAHSCLSLCDSLNSLVHGILQVAMPSSRDLPDPGVEPGTTAQCFISVLTASWNGLQCVPSTSRLPGTLGSTSALLLGSTPWSISAPKAEVATSWLPWLLTNTFKQVSLVIYLALK